jgi:hypothetical protein
LALRKDEEEELVAVGPLELEAAAEVEMTDEELLGEATLAKLMSGEFDEKSAAEAVDVDTEEVDEEPEMEALDLEEAELLEEGEVVEETEALDESEEEGIEPSESPAVEEEEDEA